MERESNLPNGERDLKGFTEERILRWVLEDGCWHLIDQKESEEIGQAKEEMDAKMCELVLHG